MPFDVVGYYYGEAMAGPFCPDCHAATAGDSHDSNLHPVFRDSEADTPSHCLACDALIRHDLTPDGIEYVRDAVQAGDGDAAVLAAWREAYLSGE
jgi:hypothetical protein